MNSQWMMMLDLETMGTGQNSAIIEIGAVVFSLNPEMIQQVFQARISLQSCLAAGLEVDDSTLRWWLQQEPEARTRVLEADDVISLQSALRWFYDWYTERASEQKEPLSLWARGTDFDVALLKNAFARCGMQPPFKYNQGMDLRTILRTAEALGLQDEPYPGVATPHVDVDDCKIQIWQLQRAWNHIARRSP